MSLRLPLLFALSLAACGGPAPAQDVSDDPTETGDPVAKSVDPVPEAVEITKKDDLVDFSFAWPIEASMEATLARQLIAEAETSEAELRTMAEEGAAFAKEDGRKFPGYFTKVSYRPLGQSERLLSLSREFATFTGGAHGNQGTHALIWDRETDSEVESLFAGKPRRDAALRKRWCVWLEGERMERRGGEVVDGMFGECPSLDEITIMPMDEDGNGLFDHFVLIANPYVAGPWAEGVFETSEPIDQYMIDAMRPEYQSSFEVGQ
ncbi:PdaC/SigV domain-containing protein [Sphingomicrobium nitratireducens]|uniref:PdaC/SigV domain-containing protein n=1 Tax=Sphingomicrobium nitratireducens TaxID=2964666 RepID=UPI00223F21B1|nr:DUF4163 domain-containing protein [Sphingomicrobium nitratireducens]